MKAKVGNNNHEEDGQQLEEGWVLCEKCSIKLKEKNLALHMEKVHDSKPSSAGSEPKNFVPLLVVIGLIVLLIGAGVYYGITSNNGPDDNGIDVPDSDWLDVYSPKFRASIYDDDWWTVSPQQSPSSGKQVAHPSWITERIKNGPILVLAHSEGCAPCIQQQEDVVTIKGIYGSDMQFLDLLSGSDARATEAFGSYDPNGSPNYIPLTILFTLIKDNSGNVRIAWHSHEGATGGEWLTNYVKDAIYYHHENVSGWS
ncbi:MAG: hypothetical protein MUC62_06175 [Candidatus Thermoplasmatota archaeon]|jgi:hypothetical protein|nr:hypothetical protein [Candidatus Thermoplasmatota archaeon]